MTESDDHSRPIAVLGATGTTGSRVTALLRRRNATVRPVSRRTDPRFDWTDPETWPAVVDRARSLYLVPPEPPAAVDEFVGAAVAAGVERIVVLSARAPEQSGQSHLVDVEAAVIAAAPSWTIIRPAWFAQNFSEGFFRPALDAGELRLPVGEGREPFIDADDIAEAAVAALTEDRHHGRVYELTGPEPLSFAEAVDLLAKAVRAQWRFVPAEPGWFAADQAEYGTPSEVVEVLLNLFAAIREGENETVSSDVRSVLGRPPASFGDFAARAAASWDRVPR